MSSIVSAFAAWLPYPVYEFRGGPFDGERREVSLHKTDRGMEPPGFWNVQPKLALPSVPVLESAPLVVTITRSTYRFIPGHSFNEGHYEFVE